MQQKRRKGGSNAIVKVGFGAKGSTFIPMIAGFAGRIWSRYVLRLDGVARL